LQSEMETKEWVEAWLSSCRGFCFGWGLRRRRGIAHCEMNRDKITRLCCLLFRKRRLIVTYITDIETQLLKCFI
jgi:hypothetical protein